MLSASARCAWEVCNPLFRRLLYLYTSRNLFLRCFLSIIAFLTIYPVGFIFLKSFVISAPGQPETWGLQGWSQAFNHRHLSSALFNTLSLATIRIFISSTLAIIFAWIVTRTDIPLRGSIEFMLWLGFFLPILPMTMGWILLLDSHYGPYQYFSHD